MREGSASGKPVALASEWVLPGGNASDDDDATLCSVLTLAIWFSSVAVGILGLALPYACPKAPVAEYPAIRAEFLEVQLVNDPQPIPMAGLLSPAPASFKPPMPLSLPKAVSIPKPPPLIAVASPLVAFALPEDAPAKAFITIESKHDTKHAKDIKPATEENPELAKPSDQAVGNANKQTNKSLSPSEPQKKTSPTFHSDAHLWPGSRQASCPEVSAPSRSGGPGRHRANPIPGGRSRQGFEG
jgi:hypothetical protein